MRISPRVVADLRQRLQEIAEVAAVAGGLGFAVLDGADSTLRLEVGGYVVSYVISDVHRELTVLSVTPAPAE